jgi:hypothetical protein
VPSTLLAVTAPSNNETEVSVTVVFVHAEPLTANELKATTEADAGYPDGPRLEAGVPTTTGA